MEHRNGIDLLSHCGFELAGVDGTKKGTQPTPKLRPTYFLLYSVTPKLS